MSKRSLRHRTGDPLCFRFHSTNCPARRPAGRQIPAAARKEALTHDRRRLSLLREGPPGRDGRPQVRRHARELAALFLPHRCLERRNVQGGPRLRRVVDPRLDGHPRVRHARDAGPGIGPPRPVLLASHGQRHRERRRPGHGPGLLERPAPRGAQGGSVPERHRRRRHVLHRAGAGVLHLRRSPLRADAEPRLLPDRLGRGRLEHRPHRGAESRLQAELQGGLLPGEPHRHVPRPARRDGLRDAQGRHRRRGAPS